MNKIAIAVVLLTFVASPAFADPIIYPAKGQSAEQQNKDQYECYSWAKGQSNFDPMAQVQQSAPQESRSGVFRGAAKGALAGVAIGAIAGDAGEGAAIGAASGGLLGNRRRNVEERGQEQAQASQQQAYSAARSDYNRAFGACMEGRGYTVK